MSNVTININTSGGEEQSFFVSQQQGALTTLAADIEDLKAMMGPDRKPFPPQGTDGFLSHFIITLEMLQGELAGKIITLNMPSAMQTVARSEPFIYDGPDHQVKLRLPPGSQLPDTIKESDFLNKADGFFEKGKQTVWMQILNLDARMEDTPIGPIRVILGETVKREYPDIFQPSLGVAQSLSRDGGFPAKLFFNPYAIIETRFGNMRAIHGNLSYGRTVDFPPIGTPISICEMIPLEAVDDVRKFNALRGVDQKIQPVARIIALSHPIDTKMQVSGDEAHAMIEKLIAIGKDQKSGD